MLETTNTIPDCIQLDEPTRLVTFVLNSLKNEKITWYNHYESAYISLQCDFNLDYLRYAAFSMREMMGKVFTVSNKKAVRNNQVSQMLKFWREKLKESQDIEKDWEEFFFNNRSTLPGFFNHIVRLEQTDLQASGKDAIKFDLVILDFPESFSADDKESFIDEWNTIHRFLGNVYHGSFRDNHILTRSGKQVTAETLNIKMQEIAQLLSRLLTKDELQNVERIDSFLEDY